MSAAPRALIAEDEPLMAERLVRLLHETWPELEIACVARSGEEALAFHAPDGIDVLFLNIRMPGLSGLEVAELVLPGPQVVVTTAYDEHAIAAFEAGAVDYLLKPIVAPRLATTIARVRQRLAAPAAVRLPEIRRIVSELLPRDARAPRRLGWLRCSIGDTILLIKVADVLYLASDTKYTRVVTAAGEGYVRLSVRELLEGLDPELFWQIHRGTIVNVEAIDRVARDGPGKLQVLLRGRPERLSVSRAYVHRFKRD